MEHHRSTIEVISLAALLALLLALDLLKLGSKDGSTLGTLLLDGIALLESLLHGGFSLLRSELSDWLSWLLFTLLLSLLALLLLFGLSCTFLALLRLGLDDGCGGSCGGCGGGNVSEKGLELLEFSLLLLLLGN